MDRFSTSTLASEREMSLLSPGTISIHYWVFLFFLYDAPAPGGGWWLRVRMTTGEIVSLVVAGPACLSSRNKTCILLWQGSKFTWVAWKFLAESLARFYNCFTSVEGKFWTRCMQIKIIRALPTTSVSANKSYNVFFHKVKTRNIQNLNPVRLFISSPGGFMDFGLFFNGAAATLIIGFWKTNRITPKSNKSWN